MVGQLCHMLRAQMQWLIIFFLPETTSASFGPQTTKPQVILAVLNYKF